MGIYALIPIQESLHVDNIADLEGFNGLIDIGGVAAEVGLNGEGINLIIDGCLEVEVAVSFLRTGTIIVVKECYFFAVKLGSNDGHTLEAYELILMLFKLIGAEQSGYVKSLSNIAALFNFKGCVDDLDLARPSDLVPVTLILVPTLSFA